MAAIRGDRAEARYRLKQAYDDSVKVTGELRKQSYAGMPVGEFVKLMAQVIRSPKVIAHDVAFYAPRKYAWVKRSPKTAEALRAYVPFAETVAQAHNVIDPTVILPAPWLGGDLGEDSLLEWAEPGR